MAKRDTVTLIWEGHAATGEPVRITQDKQVATVGQALGFLTPQRDVLKFLDGSADVFYTVIPYSANARRAASMRAARESRHLSLSIRHAQAELPRPAPTVDGVVNGLFDPAADKAVIRAPAATDILKNDVVVYTWRGSVSTATISVTVATNGSVPTGIVAQRYITENAGGKVTASYRLLRRAVEPGVPSLPFDFRIDEASLELPAPTVDEASAGKLDPVAAGTGATVVVPESASFQPGDTATATFAGAAGSYTTSPPKPGSPGMRFIIPPADIARHLGASVSVFYTRITGATLQNSAVLTLQVLDFLTDDPGVSKPSFREANGTFTLDLNTFAGGATVSVAAWPLMAAGQRFWLRATGGGNTWPLATNEVVQNVGAFTRNLARNLLDTLADNSVLRLQLTIAFNGGSEATATSFSSKPYTVRAKQTQPSFTAPVMPQAPGGSLPGNAAFATLRVPANAGLLGGDTVTAYFAGNPIGPKQGTPGVALDFNVMAAYIAANQGKTVDCQYTVLRNGKSWPSATLEIQVTTPANEWDLEYDFDKDRVRYIGPGSTLQCPESGGVMKVRFDMDSKPPAAERIGIEAFPFTPGGEFAGNNLYIGYPPEIGHNNLVFLDFDQPWDVVRFAVTSASREVTISFKDASLNLIGEIHYIGTGGEERQTLIVHDDNGLGRIRHAEIRSLEIIRLDAFKFRKPRK
jgi:hypothetical protein